MAPQYSPLPPIELDPRTESELVSASARRVYEASGGTINDFASGSPVVALLEGQAFAQSEFLYFANQFPEAVLVEWIGPFLGAQRRTGAGASAEITLTIDPRDQEFVVFPGFEVATDPNETNGVSITFVTVEKLEIPAGETEGTTKVVATFRGENTNVAAGSINKTITSLSGIAAVTNVERSSGGQDPELLSEVKERFYSLIRRRNPVSADDWQDFFSDALGPGTSTTVLPRRSERDSYNYGDNYVQSNPAVSFFVLNPDGSPITNTQQAALQNLVKWSLPTEFLGFVYPMEVDDIDITVSLNYDPTKPYAQSLNNFTRTIRDNLFAVMTPNAVFPVDYNPSITDLESALAATFPVTLGVNNAYVDPDIASMRAYFPPTNIALSTFRQTTPTEFVTGDSIQQSDLVLDNTGTNVTYYPTLSSFTPATNDIMYYVNLDNLHLKVIKSLELTSYNVGDVILSNEEDGSTLHVCLISFTYDGRTTLNELMSNGYLSPVKIFSSWSAGTTYLTNDAQGNYDPELIAFDPSYSNFDTYAPQTPTNVAQNMRPGYPVFVVNNSFTTATNTTDLGQAQNAGLVSTDTASLVQLAPLVEYTVGQYVTTPPPETIRSTDALSDVCYVNQVAGAIQVYAVVLKDFTFDASQSSTYAAAIDQLAADNYIKIVQLVPFVDCNGVSSFSAKPFRYRARFAAGEYVRYRAIGGYNASDLEECLRQTKTCANVTSPCKRLLEDQLALPRYFYVLKDFTPYTTSIDTMVADGKMEEVANTVFVPNYKITLTTTNVNLVTSDDITAALISQSQITSASALSIGDTVEVTGGREVVLGMYYWNSAVWTYLAPGLPTYRDMFRFAPGDVAAFRNGSKTKNYAATKHVTPILSLELYYDNGVFVPSEAGENVKYFDSTYRMEDVVLSQTSYSTSFFRAISSFTPPALIQSWSGETANTPRIEEVYRNLLKFVDEADCSEAITSRLANNESTIKLGIANISIKSKSSGSATDNFVWESTVTSNTTPTLSYYPNTSFAYKPVDYGTGTLAL